MVYVILSLSVLRKHTLLLTLTGLSFRVFLLLTVETVALLSENNIHTLGSFKKFTEILDHKKGGNCSHRI